MGQQKTPRKAVFFVEGGEGERTRGREGDWARSLSRHDERSEKQAGSPGGSTKKSGRGSGSEEEHTHSFFPAWFFAANVLKVVSGPGIA